MEARLRAEADLKAARATIADDKRKYDEVLAAQEQLKVDLQKASTRSNASSPTTNSDASPYARLVRFTTIVTDQATPSAPAHVEDFSKAINVPVPLIGWKCRTTNVRNATLPAPGSMPPTPVPVQAANLACAYQPPPGSDWTHVNGISVVAACALATTDDESTQTFTLQDATGHQVDVVLWCRNH